MSEMIAVSQSAAERWKREATERNIAHFVQAVSAGHGHQITRESSTSRYPGEINGMIAIEKHSPFAAYIAERAERRTSTANV